MVKPNTVCIAWFAKMRSSSGYTYRYTCRAQEEVGVAVGNDWKPRSTLVSTLVVAMCIYIYNRVDY